MTKVFISYSHDSDAHRERVLDLSNRLRTDGIDCDIDQYDPTPDEGWPLWMLRHMQDANYVLLVCTETYQKRVEQREEPGKGLGVRWEGMLLLNQLYRNQSLNTKFIPIIFKPVDEAFVPDPVFGFSRYDLSQPRAYDHLYRHIRGELGAAMPPLGQPHFTRTIYSNSLPTVEGELFGRKDELALLDQAWANPQTHVIQFIASGGTGKTKLLKHWLDSNTDSIEALLAWSFYSQGSSEDKQVSATPFFTHAFATLQSDKTSFATEEEKGEHLARLLRQQRCLLVLDGLEPLQHAGRGMRGEVKDRAIRQLLKSLADDYTSLCIITTRIAVHELSDRRAHVISHDLQNLAPADGVSLLKSWQVHGSDKELETAVREYGCHALALHLLGNALHSYLDGDVRKRDTLDELMGDYDDIERHAFKVMQAYQRWLVDEAGNPTAELQLLYLLGLFDHPIESEVLEVLWQAQIPELTAAIPLKVWKIAIRDLREKHRLLSAHEGRPDLLDCHPLIREYFGRQLQSQQPEGWRKAHERLYEYYRVLPEKELPDTLEEMQPLFSAVAHGCAAGLYEQVLEEVYWPRIQRKSEYYCVKKLGAFSDDLSTIRHFFTTPWHIPSISLPYSKQAIMLNRAGAWLRSLGRLYDAQEPMKASIDLYVKQESWKYAAVSACNLSELQLALGNVGEALIYGQHSVDYADQSGDISQRIARRTTHADALHQAGKIQAALALFKEAEQLQQEWQPKYPLLYSLPGFCYSDLLLSQHLTLDVLERTEQTLKWFGKRYSLMTKALDQLTLGHAYLQQREYLQAFYWLNQAVEGLRAAGDQSYLPRGLLVRAVLHRATGDFARARQDLQEVLDIAEPSGMRLHLTDYHLEMARVLLAEAGFDSAQPSNSTSPNDSGTTRCLSGVEGNMKQAQTHIKAAAKLINETDYHRRDKELAELQAQLPQS